MNPRMRAFSGLVTLLAVLNISWASSIWSLVRDKFLRCPGTEATGVVIVCTAGWKKVTSANNQEFFFRHLNEQYF